MSTKREKKKKSWHDPVNQKYVIEVCLSLNYTTSEWQCPKLLMFKWWWMILDFDSELWEGFLLFCFFLLLFLFFEKKCVVGQHNDTTTKQASVREGQKSAHTINTSIK